ncbi:MAG: tetratricopeptide repeat protein [Zoogloea sp.]|uniref:tetratricopeptide repeat protein n=1 Tax=Zoogloea sp. TaxID=49181 RepID=UPI002618C5AD|nr:tetratricopeptide repeat protein [Zoogloea sp.]MDD2990979.1 tetratricopeptide repeat protein [Zoogloea sp.]
MRDFSLDVSESEFDTAVLALSRRVPVLVDFWAPWCGPCRTLKPLLEKLAVEYGGRFVLAKINSDEAQAVAARYAVRSIPAVKLFVNGEVVDEFAGALPEGQVRAFLDRHLPDEAERLRLSAAGIADPLQRAELLQQAASLSGGRTTIVLELVQALLDADLVEDAAAGLETVDPQERDDAWRSLKARLDLMENAPTVDEPALEARIRADAKDFDARFALAAARAGRGEWAAAFDQLLDVVLRDRAEARGKARDTLVEWFGLCPDAKAVMSARRQLSMYLN